MTTDEKLIYKLNEMLPDRLGTQCALYSLFHEYQERKCKEFWLWCFLNEKKISELKGYYNAEQRGTMIYELFRKETENAPQAIK